MAFKRISAAFWHEEHFCFFIQEIRNSLQAGEMYQAESQIEKVKEKHTDNAKCDIFQYIPVINRLDCIYF